MVLPAILNPFVDGAPAAVMTRITLDWILDGTPLDVLFDEVAAGQYTRELTLTHFVQVMLDVASGYRPSPRGPGHGGPSGVAGRSGTAGEAHRGAGPQSGFPMHRSPNGLTN